MKTKILLCLMSATLAWALFSIGCGGDDDDNDNDSDRFVCAEDADLEIEAAAPAAGLNLVANDVELGGGCFDSTATAVLIDDDGQERDLDVVEAEDAFMTVTIPAGIALGQYTIQVTRGELTAETDYTAISEIVVGGLYEGAFHVLDIAEVNNPEQALVVQPWPEEYNRWIGHPTVNHEGLRVYFWDEDSPSQGGIYGADLADGANVEKITNDLVMYYHTPDASPTEAKITYLGCAEVANVCDIYVVNEDGTEETLLARVDETVEVNDDTTGCQGLFDPVFSPDGSKIAYLRFTTCEGSTEPEGCEYDYYALVMVMNADGSGKEIAYWEPGSLAFTWLHWTPDGSLVWGRTDGATEQFQILPAGAAAPITITPPNGSWYTEWNIWGDGIVWMAYSPADEAMILQPFDTNYAVYFPLTVTGSTAQAGEGILLNPADPDNPGETIGHYIEYDWFVWRP